MALHNLIDSSDIQNKVLNPEERASKSSFARKTFSALVAGTLVTTMLIPMGALAAADETQPQAAEPMVAPGAAPSQDPGFAAAPVALTLEERLAADPFKGSDIALLVLKEEPVTYEQLLTIDMDALRDFDKDLFEDVEKLLVALAPAPVDPAPAPVDPAPVDPEPAEPEAPADPIEAVEPAPAPSASLEAAQIEDLSSLYPEWNYEGDKSFTMPHYSGISSNDAFVASIGEQARVAGEKSNLYASLMIAHSLVASDFGKAAISDRPHNNIYGLTKTEVSDGDGSRVQIGWGGTTSSVADYDNWQDSIEDYAAVLTGAYAAGVTDGMSLPATLANLDSNPYRGVNKTFAPTVEDAAIALQVALGAEDGFADQLLDLIDEYDLTRFDEKLTYETAEPLMVTVTDPETGHKTKEERTLADLTAEATSYLGLGYIWGGTTPAGFDCSGFVQYCYREILGINIPRTTHYQCLIGQDVDFADLHAGDLVFFVDGSNVVGHVGMYLGDGYYIESGGGEHCVNITAMDETTPSFAKRIIPTVPVEEDMDEAEEIQLEPLSEEEVAQIAARIQQAGSSWGDYMKGAHVRATARTF